MGVNVIEVLYMHIWNKIIIAHIAIPRTTKMAQTEKEEIKSSSHFFNKI
jgi:hypothetical protein